MELVLAAGKIVLAFLVGLPVVVYLLQDRLLFVPERPYFSQVI